MKTWIVPLEARDGRKLFASVQARTRIGAIWAYSFGAPIETGEYLDLLNRCARIGKPVELNAWLKSRVSA